MLLQRALINLCLVFSCYFANDFLLLYFSHFIYFMLKFLHYFSLYMYMYVRIRSLFYSLKTQGWKGFQRKEAYLTCEYMYVDNHIFQIIFFKTALHGLLLIINTMYHFYSSNSGIISIIRHHGPTLLGAKGRCKRSPKRLGLDRATFICWETESQSLPYFIPASK